MLVPLASDARFMPLMFDLLSIGMFVQSVVDYQIANDVADPENVIGQIAASRYQSMATYNANEIKPVVALNDFFKQGRYDEKIAARKGMNNFLLSAGQMLYSGNYAEAFTMMTAAVRESNKKRTAQTKGYFSRLLNNYLLVMSYYFYKPDEGRKLAAVVKKDYFRQDSDLMPVVWLAEYFASGKLPSAKALRDAIEDLISKKNDSYNEYREAKAHEKELQLAKDNILKTLEIQEPKREEKHEK